ncbi:MAG TPA: DUF4276 family protein [Gemmataceae bacterium]|nr:DUF4276 family protein [Gemmataceae bacterium]
MARLNIIVEGHSEEAFVNDLLVPHLARCGVYASARRVETSREKSRRTRKTAKTYRGGVSAYPQVKKDIKTRMKQDQDANLSFTTMFDLYALPDDFPGFSEAAKTADPYRKVAVLEDAWRIDLAHPRFIPYLQLHEFEALILVDPALFALFYDEHPEEVAELVKMCAIFASPELIDDSPQQAPSKRIIRLFPDYGERGGKTVIAPLLTHRSASTKCAPSAVTSASG